METAHHYPRYTRWPLFNPTWLLAASPGGLLQCHKQGKTGTYLDNGKRLFSKRPRVLFGVLGELVLSLLGRGFLQR